MCPDPTPPNPLRKEVSALPGLEPDPTQAYRAEHYILGKTVVRIKGPLHAGQVVSPTNADLARGVNEVGSWGELEKCVLVHWGHGLRSWEYAADLRDVAGEL
jgi:hypothetical protein